MDKNRCRLYDSIHEVQKEYLDSSIFVCTSRFEGFGMGIIEAMACGLPVVCSEIRGNVDLIKKDVGGYYFKPDDVRTLEKSLGKIIESPNLRIEFGNKNKKAIENFSLANVLAKMKEILL